MQGGRAQANSELAARMLAGVVLGDHVCCTFGSEAEHAALVGRYARDAIARSERLLYMCDRSDALMVRRYLDAAGIETSRRLASGQVQISSAAEAYRGAERFDVEEQVEHFVQEKRAARADGFSGLAAIAEMSWASERKTIWEDLIAYEHAIQRIFGGADVRGVCQYDRRAFPQRFLDEAIAAHDFAVGVARGSSWARRGAAAFCERTDRPGLRISGELDPTVGSYLTARLDEHLPGDSDIVVDVGEVKFADVSGARAIAQAALALRPPRRLVLANVPASLTRVLELCGWSDLPQLTLQPGRLDRGLVRGSPVMPASPQRPDDAEVSGRFPADVHAPRAARRLIADALGRRGHRGGLLEDARLIVSELANNAVLHARSPFSVAARFLDSRVRISVHDASRVEPALRHDGPMALSGRGLRLVAALASSWGFELTADGKTVWAELEVAPERR